MKKIKFVKKRDGDMKSGLSIKKSIVASFYFLKKEKNVLGITIK